jgi:hypothetical protein
MADFAFEVKDDPAARSLYALGKVLMDLRYLTPEETRLTLLRAQTLLRTYGRLPQ